jgi:hypothetical protein
MYHKILLALISFSLNLLASSCREKSLQRDAGRGKSEAAITSPGGDYSGKSKTNKIPRIENAHGGDETEYTIDEAATIATDITGAYLNLPKGTTELGKAYSVNNTSSPRTDVWRTLLLFLPSSNNQDPNLVVLYRSQKEGIARYGLIPKSQLSFEQGIVAFQLQGPGTYQVAHTSTFQSQALDVPIDESKSFDFTGTTKLSSIGKPFDFSILNGDLFVASDQQIEYFKAGALSSSKLVSENSIRRISIGSRRPYVAAQSRGLGFFTGFAASVSEYQGSMLTATAASEGTFEIGTSDVTDNSIVLLQQHVTADAVAHLGFFNIANENPSSVASYIVKRSGNQSLNISSTNLSTSLGALVVRQSRIYTILADGLHSLARYYPDGIANDIVVSGLDQPFCIASGSSDTIIFVCHQNSKIAVVQSTDNFNPRITGEVDIGESLLAVAVDNGLLFALAKSGKLYVYDVADPAKIIRRGDPLDLGLIHGIPLQMRVLDSKLYIGYDNNAIMVYTY